MSLRTSVKPKVIAVLAAVAQVPPMKIEEMHRLEKDLGLTRLVRKALAVPFSAIATSYPDGTRVIQAECEAMKTVKNSIDVVTAHAEGKL